MAKVTSLAETRLLQDVFDHFMREGCWPLVRELQVRYRHEGNVRLLAQSCGEQKVVCTDGDDGICFLRLTGIAQCEGGGGEIHAFLEAIRLVARVAIEHPGQEVTARDLREALELDPSQLARLGDLLKRNSSIWSGGSWGQDPTDFRLTPRTDAVFYERVTSLDEYDGTKARVDQEALEAASLGIRRGGGPGTWPTTPLKAPSHGAQLRHPGLNEVLQSDLVELEMLRAAGAWKAAGIIAGSCLEAVLLDVWWRNETAARAEFKTQWPDRVSAGKLAEAAARAGCVNGAR